MNNNSNLSLESFKKAKSIMTNLKSASPQIKPISLSRQTLRIQRLALLEILSELSSDELSE